MGKRGPKPKPKVIKQKELVTKEYKKQVIRVYRMLRDGVRPEEIYSQLMYEQQIEEKPFRKLLEDAYGHLENDLHKDREFVFQLHMARYEQNYERLMVMEKNDGTPLDTYHDWLQIKTRYRAAMGCLRSKEDLLGVHDKSIVLEFKEGKAIVGEQVNISGPNIGGYNLDNLTIEESIELLKYIQEARTVPIEGVQRVTIKKTVIEITNGNSRFLEKQESIDNPNIQDITYEEMPDNVVSKMIDTRKAVVEEEPEPSIIEDSRPADMPEPKGLDQVQQSFNKKLLSQFKQRLNRS